MKTPITIDAVTFNYLEYTKLFLESIRNFADVPYKLIVVDNHSTDGAVDFLPRQKDFLLNYSRKRSK